MNTQQICIGQKHLPLYNYFRTSCTAVMKLSFEKIEEITSLVEWRIRAESFGSDEDLTL